MLNVNIHENLEYYTRHLADFELQKEVWPTLDEPPHQVRFDDIMHFFFDDTPLSDDPEDCVGKFLREYEEVEHVRNVISAIDDVLKKYGNELEDAEYIRVHEWQVVVAAAKAAYKVISAPLEPLPPEAEGLAGLVHDSYGAASAEGELAYLGAIKAYELAYRENLRTPGYFTTPEFRERLAAVKADLKAAAGGG